MGELQKPKKGEYWTIKYGLTYKTKHIVLVLEDKKLEVSNWREHHFKCRYDDGTELEVAGGCFIEKWN